MAISVFSRKNVFAAGFALMLSLLGLSLLTTSKVLAGDCDNNAIIYCGEASPSKFIAAVKANDNRNGRHDLQAIYAAYGLEPSSYDRFVKYARAGTAYKDGRIVVDGQVVATHAKSIGRLASYQGSGYFTQQIGGTTYYGNTNDKAFASNSIPVLAMFDANGVMQFAVLTSCSNPITGNKTVPRYSCDLLEKKAVPGKANTYTFTTRSSQSGNASIYRYVYNFGDGKTATTTSGSTPVTHTYTKAGNYTVKVRIYVNLPGQQQTTAVSSGCETTIKVVIPFYQCLELAGTAINQSRMSFRFVAKAKFGNGATLTSADFNFGNGHYINGVKPQGDTVTTDYTYPRPGNYDATALLHFNIDGKSVTAPACKALVTPTTPPTPECKPGVPVGSPECIPCPYDNTLPSDSPKCVAPPSELPNTGAGNTIAIIGVAAVAGFLAYRQIIFRRHKAAFVAAERGTLPRLDINAPFNDAPEPPQNATPASRRSFRRRRPF